MRGPKPKDRSGESNIMKNGMKAVIVRYKSSAEIDVEFEDGVVVKNKTYHSFQMGMIGHPDTLHKCKIKDRTGQTNIMFNGMKATILNYRNSHDIDVKFEDGSIRTGCAYKEFKSGNIAHPNHTSDAMAETRLGEQLIMNCGIAATITKYDGYHNIEVTFEDGIVVDHIDYGQFSNKSIAHPNCDNNISLQESSILFYLQNLGFQKMKRGSLKDIGFGNMELDLFNQERSIAIEIDGHFHNKNGECLIRDLNKNQKCNNAKIKLYRIRDKDLPMLTDGISHNYILNGELLYNGLYDCTDILKEILSINNIKMPTDDYIDFKRDLELIKDFHFNLSLNYNKFERLNTTVFHKATNQFMTIIEYKDYHNVTVQFDDGAIAYNKNYGSFIKGTIKHPNDSSEYKRIVRLGQIKTMNCGYDAKIIEYRNSEDIDIQFEDGSIREHITYHNFNKGNVKKNS